MKVALWSLVIIITGYALTRLVSHIPADCDDVGEQLASYELGNYAEPEQRAPTVEKYRALCKSESVDIDEGACLDKAKTRLAAARCVPRLFPDVVGADCEGAACTLRMLDKLADAMCDCRNKACTDRVQNQMNQWAQMMAQDSSEVREPPGKAEIERMQATVQRYSTCMSQALTARQ